MTRKRREYDEQARIIGMGAEREDKLRRQLEELLKITERFSWYLDLTEPRKEFVRWKRINGL